MDLWRSVPLRGDIFVTDIQLQETVDTRDSSRPNLWGVMEVRLAFRETSPVGVQRGSGMHKIPRKVRVEPMMDWTDIAHFLEERENPCLLYVSSSSSEKWLAATTSNINPSFRPLFAETS